jgi:hypothetical protein
MNLKYELTKQDYIDFNINHMKVSPILKRLVFIQQFIIPAFYLILPIFIYSLFDTPLWIWYAAFIPLSILWAIFYPKHTTKLMSKRLIRMLDEGKTDTIIGEHDMTISEEGITDKTEQSETKYKKIEKIIETKKHLFLYVNSVGGYIIPITAFGNEEEKKAFLTAVRKLK